MNIKEYVDLHKDEYVKELCEFVSIPSVSSTGQCLKESADSLQAMMERAGIKTQILPTSTYPVVRYQKISPDQCLRSIHNPRLSIQAVV